jgi:hypothetical protein
MGGRMTSRGAQGKYGGGSVIGVDDLGKGKIR